MGHAIAQLAQALKSAREGKSLSQRALARLAGIPQSHISNIESGAVDLRLSSLIEIARALDLEVALVPRATLVAVQSIMRGSRKVAPAGARSASSGRELRKLQGALDDALSKHPTVKELASLQSSVRDLQRLEAMQVPAAVLRETIETVRAFENGRMPLQDLRRALSGMQSLRNRVAHDLRRAEPVKPAYSLDEEHDG